MYEVLIVFVCVCSDSLSDLSKTQRMGVELQSLGSAIRPVGKSLYDKTGYEPNMS